MSSPNSKLRQRTPTNRPSSRGSTTSGDSNSPTLSGSSSSPSPSRELTDNSDRPSSAISVYDDSGNKIETSNKNKDKDKAKNKDNKPKGKVEKKWTNEQEIILRKWAEVSKAYSWMHQRAYFKYRWQNFWFSIPVIILSNLTGIANFAQSSIPDDNPNKKMVPLVIGTINITAGIITTVYQFLKVSELVEAHRQAHINYSKFARSIETELQQIKEYRAEDGSFFLKTKQEAYDGFIESSPVIPKKILSEFSDKFGGSRKCHGGSNDYIIESKCARCENMIHGCWTGFWGGLFGKCGGKSCVKCCNIICNKADSPKNKKITGSGKGRGRGRGKAPKLTPINEEATPETIRAIIEGDQDSDDDESDSGSKPSTEQKCTNKSDCNCHRCSNFWRPEINDIRPVEICSRTIEDEKHEQLVRRKKYIALGVIPPDEDTDDKTSKADIEMALAQRLAEMEGEKVSSHGDDPELRQQQMAEQLTRQMEQSVETILQTHQQEQYTSQIADDLFSRGRSSQFQEHQQRLDAEIQSKNKSHLDGLMDMKTGLTPQTREEITKRHPSLPPSKFLELAKQQQKEFQALSDAGVLPSSTETPVVQPVPSAPQTPSAPPAPPAPPAESSTPTPDGSGNIVLEMRDISNNE